VLEDSKGRFGGLSNAISREMASVGERHGEFAMPLERGEVHGYNIDRMVVEFTLLNQGKAILCAISTAAMDDLEGRRDVKPDERVGQFKRLRDVIEERA